VRTGAHHRRMDDTDHRLFPRLQRDWERLRHRPDAITRARSWGLTDQPVGDLDELLALAGFEVAGDAATEACLRELVLLAAVDPLAARLVLQRILPGLLAIVRRRNRSSRRTQILEELVGAAWITICEFDPRRRPSCLAAALLAGADYRAFGRDDRRREHAATPHDPHGFDDHPESSDRSPCDELAALVRATRANGATDHDLAVVGGLLEFGSPGALAAQLGVTARTVRNRRDRITARMRQVARAA